MVTFRYHFVLFFYLHDNFGQLVKPKFYGASVHEIVLFLF